MQQQASSTILFLGKDSSPLDLIFEAISGSETTVSHETDWFAAFNTAIINPPKVLLIGPDIPASDVRLFLERAKSERALSGLPSVLLIKNADRELILEFITIGIRSYVLIPCQPSALRTRIACHITSLCGGTPAKSQPFSMSIGERIRERIERKAMQDLQQEMHASEPRTAFPCLLLVEQMFSESFGLTIRESERHVSLYEKIDDLKLRLGGENSHLIGVIVELLSVGKVRIGFRDKTERLCLADPKLVMTRKRAIELVDSYLAASAKDSTDIEPTTQTCRLLVH